MLRSDFDRRPARLYQKPRPMECEELIIRNYAQAISARAGNNVPVEARGPADGRAMGRGWLRSIRALRLLLTQTLSHVTLLNPPYYFNVKRSLSKPVDLWDRHWHPLVGVNTRRRNPRCASDAPDRPLTWAAKAPRLQKGDGYIKTQSASHITCSRTRSASAQPSRVHGWASFQKVHPRFTLLTALHLRWHRPASAPPRFWKGR